MKKNSLYCWGWALLAGLPSVAWGQVRDGEVLADSLVRDEVLLSPDTLSSALSLPVPPPFFGMAAPGFDGCSPWFMGTYGSQWDLHEGFNAQMGMSVSAGFGKNAPSGVGFGQTANLAYALPLGKRFSFAGGLYVQNMDWGNWHHTDAGFSAVLGFKVNDKVSLYAYGTKSIMPSSRRQPYGYFPFFAEDFRDRIGAMAEFKIGERAKIQISVERASAPEGRFSSTPWRERPTINREVGHR